MTGQITFVHQFVYVHSLTIRTEANCFRKLRELIMVLISASAGEEEKMGKVVGDILEAKRATYQRSAGGKMTGFSVPFQIDDF